MRKVLIIEDEIFIRDLYQQAFVRAGYEVDLAAEGQEATQKVKEKKYDIILLDIMLPKVTGIDVLKIIRDPSSISHDTPVFLITNLGQEDIIKEAFVIGADGYLLKAQITPKDVVNEINTFLDNPGNSPGGKDQTAS